MTQPKIINGIDGSEYHRLWRKKWRSEHPEEVKIIAQKTNARFSNLKARAKKKGTAFNITFAEYVAITSLPCFYCNNKFCKPSIYGSGLDKVVNNLGYINGNVVSCGEYCNKIKNDFLTADEAKVAIQAILKIRGL